MQEDAASASMNVEAGTFTDDLVSNDVAVWIDPINISKALDNGDDLNNLTNMIGITVNGRPRVGIIHKPFASKKNNRTCGIYRIRSLLFRSKFKRLDNIHTNLRFTILNKQ